MAKKPDQKATIHHDFAFVSDADLNAQIAAFASGHETLSGDRLAMDSRMSLGAGKVRVTFRLVPPRSGKGRR
jgi:hypothetical protein